MSFKMKLVSAATLIAISASASAERVIVTFDSNGQGLKQGHQVKVNGNGWFAVELDEKGKSNMRGKRGFKKMEADHKRFSMAIYNDDVGNPNTQQITPYAIKQSQGDQLILQSGQKVCVIDSGLDISNPDFNYGVVTGDNDSGTGNWYENGGPHGTHVAGTVAAADNGTGVVGMAPGVPMHIIKVFNADGWGYSSDLAFAAGKCSAVGANIITMSLGGGGANSTEENAFNTFTNNGGLVLAAAGNDGNNVRSFPAGYESVMMIGANDADNNIADFSQFPPATTITGRGKKRKTITADGLGVEVTAGGVDTLSTFPADTGVASGLSADGNDYASLAMENAGAVSGVTYFMGTAEATASGADGKICVIDRGVISFHDKVLNCQNSFGIGAIIVNNEAGVLAGTLGDTNTTTIPTVGAALEDRAALVGSNDASISVTSSDYSFLSGTSMATPAAAGAAALIWSNHPGCDGTQIREAMKASAQDQGATGRDDFFGYGIVKAFDASAYLTTNPCDVTPPSPADDLTASARTSKGGRQLNVSWSGANGINVDVIINGAATTTDNDGSASFSVSKNGSYTVKVCEEGSIAVCSDLIEV
ncbi:MAG: serine protease [Arenicella sp.]|jgi:serine protease